MFGSTRGWALLTLAAAFGLAPSAAPAASSLRGLALARANCGSCHAIASEPNSPNSAAPRFADLQRLSPDKPIEEIVADGIMVRHSPMPWFAPGPDDMDDLMAYIKGIQPRRPAQP